MLTLSWHFQTFDASHRAGASTHYAFSEERTGWCGPRSPVCRVPDPAWALQGDSGASGLFFGHARDCKIRGNLCRPAHSGSVKSLGTLHKLSPVQLKTVEEESEFGDAWANLFPHFTP